MATLRDESMDLLDTCIQAVEGLLECVSVEPLAVDHAVQLDGNGGRSLLDRHGDPVGGTEANDVWGVRF